MLVIFLYSLGETIKINMLTPKNNKQQYNVDLFCSFGKYISRIVHCSIFYHIWLCLQNFVYRRLISTLEKDIKILLSQLDCFATQTLIKMLYLYRLLPCVIVLVLHAYLTSLCYINPVYEQQVPIPEGLQMERDDKRIIDYSGCYITLAERTRRCPEKLRKILS